MFGNDVVDSKIPCLKQLINCFDEYKTPILGVQKLDKNQVNKYGIVKDLKIEGNVYKIRYLIEKPSIEEAPSNIAILGRYILTPEIFEILEETKPGKGEEIQLTDALKTRLSQQDIYSYEFEGRRYDVGDKLGYLQAIVEMALKREDLRSSFVDYLRKLS